MNTVAGFNTTDSRKGFIDRFLINDYSQLESYLWLLQNKRYLSSLLM